MNYYIANCSCRTTSWQSRLQHRTGGQQSGHCIPNEVHKDIHNFDETYPKKKESKKALQSTITSILSLSPNCSTYQDHPSVVLAEILAQSEHNKPAIFSLMQNASIGACPHSNCDSIRPRCGRKRSRHPATNKHWSAVPSTNGASAHDHANIPAA